MFVSMAYRWRLIVWWVPMDGKSLPINLQTLRSCGFGVLLEEALIGKYGCKCFIYLEEVAEAQLQIDHRIPFEVAGDTVEQQPKDFMLLSGAANRAKSWSCEHCDNWRDLKKREVCLSCYWAYPENYTHVAMMPLRRLDLIWQGEATEQYEQLKTDAHQLGLPIPEYVKHLIEKAQQPRT